MTARIRKPKPEPETRNDVSNGVSSKGNLVIRARSSAGRAPGLHPGGRRFEPGRVHHQGIHPRAYSSVWLERTPDKREVGGSNPPRPTNVVEPNAGLGEMVGHGCRGKAVGKAVGARR